MAAPPTLPPLSQIDPSNNFLFNFNDPSIPRNPFMASTSSNGVQNAGQNHDRDNASGPLSPLPPLGDAVSQDQQQDVVGSVGRNDHQGSLDPERRSETDDGSGSDGEDSEVGGAPPPEPWRPIEEDTSLPCADELAYIEGRSERSALDHGYWEKKTFFDLDDPEHVAVDSGRIDFVVPRFNGTRENPNNELVMRSSIVRIGGYDWRLKFYPKGNNNSDHLSVYIECVTMQAPEFEETSDFVNPPLPFLADQERPKKRRSVAAQYSCVMYNPAEPRTYEQRIDAHQFTKNFADYGWTRFTPYSRRDFVLRNHGQRQAILRNDTLAFKAYIRVITDPTGCLWSHSLQPYEDSIAATALRPFSTLTPIFAAKLPLLHFAPFREIVYRCKDTKIVSWLQNLLWKMMSRTRSKHYGSNPVRCAPSDAVAWARCCLKSLEKETGSDVLADLVGTFDWEQGAAVSRNRLKTKSLGSVQAAVNAHPTRLATPAFLTLELERHEFDRKDRKWNKVCNRVEMENKIIVSGTAYVLFGFVTHCGDLTSNKFNVYVRPDGPSATLWYAYTDGSVKCLTQKQAVGRHCGFDEGCSPSSEKRHAIPRSLREFQRPEDLNEVAHVVYYIKEVYAPPITPLPLVESWDAPESVRKDKAPKETPGPPPAPHTIVEIDPIDNTLQRERDEQVGGVHKSSLNVAGNATPIAWVRDGEDVLMSDADEESIQSDDSASSNNSADDLVSTVTIDHLGREYFEGQMLGTKYCGHGHQISMNGDEYVGTFHDNQKNGRGKMIYATTGNIYDGEWLNDQHHGQGKLTEASTGNVFEGGWKNGKKHGDFVLRGKVTDEDKACCSICYDKEINTAFYDCGHVLACKDCAQKIDTCPVCRKRVVAKLELFGVKMTFG